MVLLVTPFPKISQRTLQTQVPTFTGTQRNTALTHDYTSCPRFSNCLNLPASRIDSRNFFFSYDLLDLTSTYANSVSGLRLPSDILRNQPHRDIGRDASQEKFDVSTHHDRM